MVSATETTMNSWQGRREVLCMGGPVELTEMRHLELVAYMQWVHGQAGDLCWDYEKDSMETSRASKRFTLLPSKEALDRPSVHSYTWSVVEPIMNNVTEIRCLDYQLCPEGYELYKMPTTTAANPFGIAKVAVSTSVLMPNLLWNSSVRLSDEERVCGIEGHIGKQNCGSDCEVDNKCVCDDSGFTAWVDDEVQDPYADNCGPCISVTEHMSHPLQTSAMNFTRQIGIRSAKWINMSAATQIMGKLKKQHRHRIPERGGCEQFRLNPSRYLNQTKFQDCDPCPGDCTFKAATRATLLGGRGYGTLVACPRTAAPCVQLPSTVCTFRREIERLPTQNGRDCRTVHRDDMKEIAKHNWFQRFVQGPGDRGVYFPEENYSYYLDSTTLHYAVHQREIYLDEPWYWFSDNVQREVQVYVSGCPRACDANLCTDVGPSPLHQSTYTLFSWRIMSWILLTVLPPTVGVPVAVYFLCKQLGSHIL